MGINKRIKDLRKLEAGSQKEFAEILGVDTSYISKLESGKKEPSEQLILSICRTFGVRYDWLTKGDGPMKDKELKNIDDYKIKEEPPELLEIIELLREEDQESLIAVKKFLLAWKDMRKNPKEYIIDKPKKKK